MIVRCIIAVLVVATLIANAWEILMVLVLVHQRLLVVAQQVCALVNQTVVEQPALRLVLAVVKVISIVEVFQIVLLVKLANVWLLAAVRAPRLERLHATMQVEGPYSPDARSAGRRSAAS